MLNRVLKLPDAADYKAVEDTKSKKRFNLILPLTGNAKSCPQTPEGDDSDLIKRNVIFRLIIGYEKPKIIMILGSYAFFVSCFLV